MKAPETIATDRLILRRPTANDAAGIFERFAADPEVTRYVSWLRHRSIESAQWFIGFSDTEWTQHPGGPYLLVSKATNQIIGSTGFGFETPYRVSTGYVLARDAWGQGYAVEAMHAITTCCPQLGVKRLYAICHVDHRRSARVLEKSGFSLEGTLRNYCTFPNLGDERPADVLCYSETFGR
jgi:ribosomal-protein-alanine N-acetyltransferase